MRPGTGAAPVTSGPWRPGVKGWPVIQQPQSSAVSPMRAGMREQVPGDGWRAVAGAHHLQPSPGKAGPWGPGGVQEQGAIPRGARGWVGSQPYLHRGLAVPRYHTDRWGGGLGSSAGTWQLPQAWALGRGLGKTPSWMGS